ncbi:MAG: hypothetical protein WCP01_12340 [Methylococcaceae bacterium]
MFGSKIIIGKRVKDDGEKPFWISFADLMSALMVLFLLVMSVALLAVTKPLSEAEKKKAERDQEIKLLLAKIETATSQYPGITIDKSRRVVEFGDKARFLVVDSSKLDADQVLLLRNFVANAVLKYAGDDLGKKWFKQIVVEGFTDRQGTYLHNLNLSLDRSQRVLCALLAPFPGVPNILTDRELEQVRDLFFVGGYSFNDSKKTAEESRRIELRLEFYGVDEEHPQTEKIPPGNFGDCKI